jgi:hypothetical protein
MFLASSVTKEIAATPPNPTKSYPGRSEEEKDIGTSTTSGGTITSVIVVNSRCLAADHHRHCTLQFNAAPSTGN